MKVLLVTSLMLSAISSFANVVQEHEIKAIKCFDEVATSISIQLSQAYHGARPNSKEEREARARQKAFTEEMESFVVIYTLCAENTDSEEMRLNCIANTYMAYTLELAEKYDAMSVVRSTPACN